MIAEVAVPLPILTTFSYRVPPELQARAKVGARVLVPFSGKERIGWIEKVGDAQDSPKIRDLLDVLDAGPPLPQTLVDLCRWVADYYIASLGIVLRTALPAVLSDSSSDHLILNPDARILDARIPDDLSDLEAVMVDWLRENGGSGTLASLRRQRGRHAWWPVIRRLEGSGMLRVEREPPRTEPPVKTRRVLRISRPIESLRERDEIFGRAHRQRQCWETVESMEGVAEVGHLVNQLGFSYAIVNGLVEKGIATIGEEEVMRDPYEEARTQPEASHTPTAAQQQAIDTLVAAAARRDGSTHLLRGVTGSGKTLVYIELLKEVVDRQGRTAIVLVPEIALTPQTVGRFRAVFGDRVAVLHSALSDGERYDEWRSLRSGEKQIAVGARSAIFAPLTNLGAIIVDEEHEGSYKQGETPRYHAREIAVVRASLEGAVCVLGSATPSLESWANAISGKYGLLHLPERAAGNPLPATGVVDLREVRKKARDSGAPAAGIVLSDELLRETQKRLERGEQAIYLLNRRGYANFVQCSDCGFVWECPSCAVSLTYHRRRGQLTCHYCLYQEPAPRECSRCASDNLSFKGIGTEQVERAVEEAFPAARTARMDVDTTSAKWSHHRILDRFGRGEIDLLMGTQMIAKGLDFPNVTLVGVINADVGINLPDFRATERTFQLITQVAGRAGRGPKGGEVIVQTSLPNHYAIQCSLAHDFEEFARRELEARRSPIYPPHCRLVNLLVSGKDEGETQRTADQAAAWLGRLVAERKLEGIDIIGPAPCPIERIRERWRWHVLLRSTDVTLLGRVTRYFAEKFRVTPGASDLRIALDRDPVALL